MGTIKVGVVQRTVFKDGKKYFPIGLRYSNITERELLNYMMQNSQVGRAAAVCGVEAFKAAFSTFLLNGHTMQVPGLGTFSLTCNCKTVSGPSAMPKKGTEEYSKLKRDVVNSVYNFRVRYTPISEIRQSAKSTSFVGALG